MKLSENFSKKVFNDKVMKKYLPKETYSSLKKSIEVSSPLEPEIASIVASAMKNWAIENGATHYTHWFQPMTGRSAGKHDGFIDLTNGEVEINFSEKCLIKGEPDASSFPNGGLRNTFEARGYTIWDCTSPAFIKDNTLYIPTAFCSYNGEALDTKTPLLRSMEVLSTQAIKILKFFGVSNVTNVTPTVGAEQEYFLIDRKNYENRLDLKICGRTLFGANPVKGQEMDDYYCSRIKIKVADYMKKLDEELWSFGICSKTKHNEVAPSQHEMAPVFESCNVAADHNQLTMEIMRVVAKKNNLACLLHEKPFSNVNGSGKHNNWSLCTNTGINLLDVGKTKKENVRFLIFLCAVIRGFSLYAGLLRMTAASAGNDCRLGGNEAPPAIMSIFLGETITKVLSNISIEKEIFSEDFKNMLITKAKTLPNLLKDDSDRNRTSPFAFTGNKFEFRMLGSSASISMCTTVINLIVAESLEYFVKIFEEESSFENAVVKIISSTVKEHKNIIFNGNNYSKEWEEEAKKRNLCIVKDTVTAAEEYVKEKNISLFEHFNVLTSGECSARYKILLKNYCETILIEAHTMLEMLGKEILPAILEYTKELCETLNGIEKLKLKNKTIVKDVEFLNVSIENINKNKNELVKSLEEIKNFNNKLDKAKFSRDVILKIMKELRKSVDSVELMVPKKFLNMPSITDLLHKVWIKFLVMI